MCPFQDTGFDLLPKIAMPQVLPEQPVIVPKALPTHSVTPEVLMEPNSETATSKGNWIGGMLLAVLLIASVAGVMYMAKKYAFQANPGKEQDC